MRRRIQSLAIPALLALTACTYFSARSVNAEAKPVSLGIFEVIDCKAGSQPVQMQGKPEKYCLAAEPVVRETDVRFAQSGMNQQGRPELSLYFTLQTGKRLHEITQRIYNEHFKRGDLGVMAIVINGKLIAAPTLRTTIDDSLVIDNAFTRGEADSLAASLTLAGPRKQ